MKHVMIRYTLKPDESLDGLKDQIKTFVDGMKAASDNVHYTSYEIPDQERAFVHIGFFPDDDTLKDIQAQPFFGAFGGFLKGRCVDGPSVTWLSPVASTSCGG